MATWNKELLPRENGEQVWMQDREHWPSAKRLYGEVRFQLCRHRLIQKNEVKARKERLPKLCGAKIIFVFLWSFSR